MQDVTAIIPTWNRRDLLIDTLRSLAAQTRPPDEVIVVDNASTDDSAAQAASLGATVFRNEANLGFARAVNRGLETVSTPWVLICNNDVGLEPEYLERLRAAVEAREAAFATGRILCAGSSEERRIDATFDLLSRGACAWRAGHGLPDGSPWDAPRLVQFAPMTAALFRTQLFRELGPLDAEFESYLEDVEFGLRCARAGRVGLYVPEALAWHWGSSTWGRGNPEVLRRLTRNQLFLIARHYPRRWPDRLGRPVVAAQGLWFLHLLRQGRGWTWWQGFREGLRSYSELRRVPSSEEARRILDALEQSERDLLNLQGRTGSERFWRWYRRLAPLPPL